MPSVIRVDVDFEEDYEHIIVTCRAYIFGFLFKTEVMKFDSEIQKKCWFEGYAEGRMQEKYNIVEFPDLIAKKPSKK